MIVRPARVDDLAHVTRIYNASIDTTATWSDRHQTVDERRSWFAARRANGDAVLVADDGGAVVGFAAYAPFRNNDLWPGYRFTVENTVHVDAAHQGRGVGRRLMQALVAEAREAGLHVMIGAIDGENEGSIRFHETLGFVEAGRLRAVGWKFDRWLDLVLMHRFL